MKFLIPTFFGFLLSFASAVPVVGDEDQDSGRPLTRAADPVFRGNAEARLGAKMLHETIRGALQIMHRDFFDEDNAGAIPSASLEDVFDELSRGFGVELKWLVVNTDVVNIDHKPKDMFEQNAAKALAEGESHFESIEHGSTPGEDRYRYAGPIRLQSQCLKCHVKRRTDNQERVAGLLISMPLRVTPDQAKH
jgi:hypothetical protein